MGLDNLNMKQLEKLAKLPNNMKLAILVAVIALLSLGYYFVVHQGLQTKLQGRQAELAKLRNKLDSTKAIASKLDDFIRELERINIQIEKYQALLPIALETSDILGQITRLGHERGVRFDQITPEREVEQEFYYEVPFEIKITAPFHAAALFFDELSNQQRIYNVVDVDMAPAADNKTSKAASFEGEDLNITCRVITFRGRPIDLTKKDKAEEGKGKGKPKGKPKPHKK